MTPRQLHRLLIAPEMIVVDAVRAALFALERAMLVEHPSIDIDPAHDDTPVQRRARAVVHAAHQLRRALRRYRTVVQAIMREARANDLPF
jgi:hypothetical protein